MIVYQVIIKKKFKNMKIWKIRTKKNIKINNSARNNNNNNSNYNNIHKLKNEDRILM
jgi:hypothetical protein